MQEETHSTLDRKSLEVMAVAVAAAALNKRELLREALRKALDMGVGYTSLYEALVQLYLFAGFPAALESVAALAGAMLERGKSVPAREVETYDVETFKKRGEVLCQQIYTSTYPKMRGNMISISPDLGEWMIIEGYGKTLSRPGLNAKNRELLIMATLAALGWTNQLYSHIRGALNMDATEEECRGVLEALSALKDPLVTERQKSAMGVLATLSTKRSTDIV